MKTSTVTFLKENASNLELDEPLLVTQNGKPAYVVQDVRDYEYQQESLALLKLLMLSEKTLREQGALSEVEVFGDSTL